MSFLAPLFLAAVALAVGPILFHLIRKTPRNRVVFSSTELLRRSAPTITSRRRIQNPWLLALRCLIIATLCFAFARPLFRSGAVESPVGLPSRQAIIALDESASMSREGIWPELVNNLGNYIDGLDPQDDLSIIAFADRATTLVSPAQWRSWPSNERQRLAKQIIAERRPGVMPSHLDVGLAAALEQLESMRDEQTSPAIGEVVIASDFIEGARVGGLAGLEWPDRAVARRLVGSASSEGVNVGMRWLGWGDQGDDADSANARLSLIRSSGDAELRVTLEATPLDSNDDTVHRLELTLGPQSETMVNFALPASLQSQPLFLELTGDSHSFDNRLAVAPEALPEARIRLFSANSASDARSAAFFISTALAGLEQPRVTLQNQFSNAEPPPEGFIIDRPLNAEEAAFVSEQVEQGAFALVLAADPVHLNNLVALSGTEGWSIVPSTHTNAMFGRIDFRHSAFTPFSDPRYSDFTNLRFWKTVTVAPPPDFNQIEVAAQYDHEDPLLLEFDRGKGRVAVWAGGWSAEDSQWTLSSKFVPWLNHFVSRSLGESPLPSHAFATSEALESYQALGPWRTVDDEESDEPPIAAGLAQAEVQGAWRWFAWQIDPAESRIRSLSDESWDLLGLPESTGNEQAALAEKIAQSERRESNSQIESTQQLWRWTLVLLLLLLAVESAAAIRLANGSSSPTESTAA